MYERSTISQLAILSVLSILVALYSTTALAQQTESNPAGPVYNISALKSDFEKNTLSIEIRGESVPAYTVSERFAPFRVIVDIAGAVFEKTIDPAAPLIKANPVGKMVISKLPDQQQQITRFEIEIADTHDYKVTRSGNNIGIIIAPAGNDTEEVTSDSSTSTPEITDFLVTTEPGETSILLAGTATLKDYKVATVGGDKKNPARMFIDVADVSISELVREKKIGTSLDKIRVSPRGTGARIVFDSASEKLFDYDVLSTASGIKVIIDEKTNPLRANLQNVAAPAPSGPSDATLDELIESSSNLLSKSQAAVAGSETLTNDNVTSLQDSFAFSGYNKQRISVDFYKIDIHNVFRLFRQITDLNIIVDEDVQGTLTLALSDVPWDFALDIILNLQDLEKEERYNTIVIYPKKKEFAWPDRAEDNLSFEADIEVVEQEALIIQQSANLPQEIMEAKEILRLARTADNNHDFEDAASLYEKAAKLWPTNTSIYNRLSTIYLVQLGMNSKAVFYARKSLEVDPNNSRAALYAAIGSANMQRITDASEFFTQAISEDPPMKEALFSFATFSETNNQNMAALKLLDKYNQYYGETVDTMLAKARIFDKMGSSDKATAQYQAIMASGFQLRPDLKQYIMGRLTVQNN
jgi:type IV pilus assembly protein PilQ